MHGPRIKITNSTHAPDSLGAIVLPTKLAAQVADVEVDASIEGRELSVKTFSTSDSRVKTCPGVSKNARKISNSAEVNLRGSPAFDTVRVAKSIYFDNRNQRDQLRISLRALQLEGVMLRVGLVSETDSHHHDREGLPR